MANPFFRFKKFTVYQDKCAMKVGTDGVLLGLWTGIEHAGSCLDIGTGTGLISLILAQKEHNLRIDAIDIDKVAIEQAKENIAASPFSDRINCYHSSLQVYTEECGKKYDLIVSNPPFFQNSLKTPDNKRTLARHTDSLSVNELISSAVNLLSDRGKMCFIYPADYRDMLTELAEINKLHITRFTNVFPTPRANVKRILIELSKEEKEISENNLILEIERHRYSDDFRELAKNFYLNM